jgi:hypothetical protein
MAARTLRKIRKDLVSRCDDCITYLGQTGRHLVIAEVVDRAAKQVREPTAEDTAATERFRWTPSSPTGLGRILDYVHMAMVQERLIFLHSAFAEAVLQILSRTTTRPLPRISLRLNGLKSAKLTELRQSISEAARDSFSFRPYEDRMDILRTLFDVRGCSELQEGMKKHVGIRNVLQHNRGVIRESDLRKIGQPQNGCFAVLDENGKDSRYRGGQQIVLSVHEIKALNKLIRNYSEKFEELP